MKRLFLSILALATLTCGMAQEATELEKKVAQMLVVGMKGTQLKPSDKIVGQIKKYGVGGMILFEHNITHVDKGLDSRAILEELCADIAALDDKIMIAVDQEGGRVNRLKSKYGFANMPSAEDVSKMSYEQAREVAAIIAGEVASAGFNTNFAPCVDLNINPKCPIIGRYGRSYGVNPDSVAMYGSIMVEEHRKFGLATSPKHFPGHGSSAVDSHNGFTDVTDTWQKEELIPYEIMFANGTCDMVMITHVFNGNIDPKYPASLSNLTINSLLRDKMGWSGVVITDDMQMGAITKNYGFEESLILAVNAGVDMLIVSSPIAQGDRTIFERSLEVIVDAVERGEISMSRIDESYERILEMKNRLF